MTVTRFYERGKYFSLMTALIILKRDDINLTN